MNDPLVGKVLAERFEMIERVGDGGTGVVYKAKQLSVDRIIAVKVLGAHVSTDPQWMKRFQNEARAASRLEHPNTVRILDFGQTREGLLFIAMEFLNGRSLRTEIERAGRMQAARTLQIIAQVCSSLAEAHSQGIIHRDIKPDNVMLVDMKGGGDMVKVLDFSVAKLDTPDAQLTRAGVVFGTPAYMSPEQGRGVPLSPQSDLYAVGIVAYEMLMGHPPFAASIPTDVVMMHLRNPPPPLSGVPSQVAELVMRALDKDPKRRHGSASEMEQHCQRLLAEMSGHFQAMGVRVPTPPPIAAQNPPEPQRGGASGQHPRTQALHAGELPGYPSSQPQSPHGGLPHGTMVLTESGGLPPGTQGLPSNAGDWQPEPQKPKFLEDATRPGVELAQQHVSPLFWVAWAILGLACGLAAHFWIASRAVT